MHCQELNIEMSDDDWNYLARQDEQEQQEANRLVPVVLRASQVISDALLHLIEQQEQRQQQER